MANENKKTVEANGFDSGLRVLMAGVEKFVDLAQKLQESGGEIKKKGTINLSNLKEGANGVFGFSIKITTAGRPLVEHFGNIKKTPKGPKLAEEREPISDVFEETKKIKVYAEMPGVNEEGISVDLKGDILDIKAVNKGRQYHKEILLPVKVKHGILEKSYKSGILEVIIRERVEKNEAGELFQNNNLQPATW